MMKKLTTLISAVILTLGLASTSLAAYPDKTITLIVPFGPGGTTDVPARLLASMMEKKFGKSIVVKNVAGAGGTIGVAEMAAAAPDGYTLGYVPTGTMCLQPHVQKLPYGRDSFDFLGLVMRQPVTVMSSKMVPWKNFQEMIDIVKKEPNKYVVGITSIGNMTHVPMASLANHYGLKFRYIPYRSSPEVMKDMITGRVHLHGDSPVSLSQFDIVGLAQFSEERIPNLKDIPTTKELGFDKIYSHWQGLVAPKGLPADVLKILGDTVQEIVTSPEFAKEAAKMSTNAFWMSPKDFQALFEKDFDMYGAEIKELMPKK